MQSPQPITQDLVLIGGGHSHAIALKKFGMSPMPGVKLTLITDVMHTPYSGMLPGYVAGLYRFDDCHIDLRPLAQFAQARLIHDRAVGLDLAQNRVLLANRPPIAFDLLSIDIGSTPAVTDIPGAKEHAIPVKPISQFLHYWDQLIADLSENRNQSMRLAIVGGGAGGVELALSVQAHLHRLYQVAQPSTNPATHLELHLFHRGDRLLPERSQWVSQQVEKILRDRGVQIHLGESVQAIEAAPTQTVQKLVCCDSGLQVLCDRIFWVTQAAAAPWLKQSGLATDPKGFVQVNKMLRSVSHPQVFAAGDVAAMVNHPRPKAGVFAVRQGKPLFENLSRVLQGKAPQPFVPQKQTLILLGTGDRKAIASRGSLGWGASSLLWQWKGWIDRQFMRQFTQLKGMSASAIADDTAIKSTETAPIMHCAGCGSKVGSSVLNRALNRLKAEQLDWGDRPDILIGLDAPDDAAVIRIPVGQVLVQTIDYFRALVDDPFLFGQICTHHCLSDLFAMGAMPQSGLAIVTLPYAAEAKQAEMLYQLLAGATQVLQTANAPLIGGHTTEATELAFGLTCNGVALPAQLWRKGGMEPGQSLILTKALGTGTLFAADMQLKAKGRWIETAIASMLLSNQAAAVCLREYGATTCTDVTGFGLLGHLLEMVRASRVSVELNFDGIPILAGAKETIQQGILSSLHPQNLRSAQPLQKLSQSQIQNLSDLADRPLFPLLFDPQTSGGLLASVPSDRASSCLTALRKLGYLDSNTIGSVLPQPDR